MTNPVTDPSRRLAALRAELHRLGLDGVLVPRGDAFLGEYVPPSAERLAWVSGFTGSAGLALVLRDRAVLFIDGRYTTQAERETDRALWELRHVIDQPPVDTLRQEPREARIGYDPWLHTEAAIERLVASGVELVPLEANPIDAVWTDLDPADLAPNDVRSLALEAASRCGLPVFRTSPPSL